MRSISCHITTLVINSLKHGHTHIRIHTNTHTNNPHKINFKKLGCGRHAWFKNPKRSIALELRVSNDYTTQVVTLNKNLNLKNIFGKPFTYEGKTETYLGEKFS